MKAVTIAAGRGTRMRSSERGKAITTHLAESPDLWSESLTHPPSI